MKLQRSTGILLGVAITLVAAVTIFETQKGTQTNQGETLFDFAEADISAFTLEREDETLTFTKTDDIWQMIEPENATADPASVAFLLNIITSDTIQETITTTPKQLKTYGLDNPETTIMLTVDDASYRLTVGDEDFSGTSRYVMTTHDVIEPNPVDIHLIPKGIENGIERPIPDWLAKDDNNSATDTIDDNTDSPQNEAVLENPEGN